MKIIYSERTTIRLRLKEGFYGKGGHKEAE